MGRIKSIRTIGYIEKGRKQLTACDLLYSLYEFPNYKFPNLEV